MKSFMWWRNDRQAQGAAAEGLPRRDGLFGRYLSRRRSSSKIDMPATTSSKQLLLKAATTGDWISVKAIFADQPELLVAQLNDMGEKALHVAAANGNNVFVEKLLDVVPDTELTALDGRGQSALAYAAIGGNEKIVKSFVQKERGLLIIGKDNPIYLAVASGRDSTAKILIEVAVFDDFQPAVWIEILLASIRSRMFDCASDIMFKCGNILERVYVEDPMREVIGILAREDDPAVTNSAKWQTILNNVWLVLVKLEPTVRNGLLRETSRNLSERIRVFCHGVHHLAEYDGRSTHGNEEGAGLLLGTTEKSAGMSPIQEKQDGPHPMAAVSSKSWVNAKANTCMIVTGMLLPMAYGAIVAVAASPEGVKKVQEVALAHGLATQFSLITLLNFWLIQTWKLSESSFRVLVPLGFLIGFLCLAVSVGSTVYLAATTISTILDYTPTNWNGIVSCLYTYLWLHFLFYVLVFFSSILVTNVWNPMRLKIAKFLPYPSDSRFNLVWSAT